MGPFAAGQVIVLPFPFSDLSASKYRPALLLANAGRRDWIACQITSNPYADALAIALTQASFDEGGLQRDSFIRPGKLFTESEGLFASVAGNVRRELLDAARAAVIAMIRGEGFAVCGRLKVGPTGVCLRRVTTWAQEPSRAMMRCSTRR